jgi:RNA polymerase sigma-70 factor (ECF subfamily)
MTDKTCYNSYQIFIRKGEGMGTNRNDKSELMENICRETWRELYRFIYYKVQNREEAEDITQETYVRALDYFNRNDIEVLEYIGYLKTIAINLLRDRWRAKARAHIILPLEEADIQGKVTEDFSKQLQERKLLEDAMAKLTEEQRTVIILRIMKGYSAKETAKLMKKREGTIRVMQYRAVKALSNLLTEQEQEEASWI